MNKKKLQIEQLERKLSGFATARKVVAPPIGWLKVVRVSLGMSLQQLADKLSILSFLLSVYDNVDTLYQICHINVST